MRIEGGYTQIQKLYGATKTGNNQKSSKTGFSDAVSISSTGLDYQTAKQAVKNVPDVRNEVTSPIQNGIQAGTYNISDEDFADKLVEKYSEIFGG